MGAAKLTRAMFYCKLLNTVSSSRIECEFSPSLYPWLFNSPSFLTLQTIHEGRKDAIEIMNQLRAELRNERDEAVNKKALGIR